MLIANATRTYVDVSLPEFQIEYEYPLKEAMESLGVNRAFDPNLAQFNISRTPLAVSDMLHKAYIKVLHETD